MSVNHLTAIDSRLGNSQDRFTFAEEVDKTKARPVAKPAWHILVVDDEPDVHEVTRLVLRNVTFLDRPIRVHSTLNADEARQFIRQRDDIALVLLDVMMESERAGLEFVRYIRGGLNNCDIQIVIRTGQPGYAPEEQVILDYEINDYLAKEDLSETRFLTSVIGALRTYHLIQETKKRTEERTVAEAAAAAKGEFLAYMSHEIRTPLNSLVSASELLAIPSSENERVEYLNIIKQSGHILLDIINETLDFSKLESGKLELESLDIHLEDLQNQVIGMFQAQVACKSVNLISEQSGIEGLWIKTDPVRLTQVLVNLVGNAIKFTESGDVTLRTQVLERSRKCVRFTIEVEDTGIGIPPDQVPYLFNAFSQIGRDTNRRFGGSGLGLAISAGIIAKMGGRVEVRPGLEGRGSCFYFTLDAECGKENKALPNAGVGTPATASSCILVAEDNAVNQLVIRKMLTHLGYEVELVGTGRETLEQVSNRRFDALLLDCQMPDMDGYQVVRNLRAQAHTRKLPVIALTASATLENKNKCLNAGMDDFLSKPVSMATLDAMLAKWLHRSASA